MIEYLQFKEEYGIPVYNLIYNIMKNELEIESKVIKNITKDLEDIQANYINNGGNFWIVSDKEMKQIVGTVGIRKIDDKNAEFKRFYVKENYRNQHIGHTLYKIAENYSKEQGFKSLYLVSGDKSKKAFDIYNKNGWCLAEDNINIKIREGVKLYKKIL